MFVRTRTLLLIVSVSLLMCFCVSVLMNTCLLFDSDIFNIAKFESSAVPATTLSAVPIGSRLLVILCCASNTDTIVRIWSVSNSKNFRKCDFGNNSDDLTVSSITIENSVRLLACIKLCICSLNNANKGRPL